MLDLSEFIGATSIEREVEFKGKKFTFHFRELSADEAETLFLSVDADPKKNKGLRNKIISKVLVTETGEPAFKPEEAGKLPNELANILNSIALEINGVGNKAAEEAKND
jgi:hypothetical protein